MADFKRVILKDPVSGENLMPVVPDILQYEIVEGQEVAPFEFEAPPSDASTLEGHPASYFAMKEHTHSGVIEKTLITSTAINVNSSTFNGSASDDDDWYNCNRVNLTFDNAEAMKYPVLYLEMANLNASLQASISGTSGYLEYTYLWFSCSNSRPNSISGANSCLFPGLYVGSYYNGTNGASDRSKTLTISGTYGYFMYPLHNNAILPACFITSGLDNVFTTYIDINGSSTTRYIINNLTVKCTGTLNLYGIRP